MTGEQLVRQLMKGRAALVTLATTGIKPDEDRIIGACVRYVDSPDAEPVLLLRLVPEDELMRAYEYHRISATLMLDRGLGDEGFAAALSGALDGCTVFSYNPPFHSAFLSMALGRDVAVRDLPLLLRGMESMRPVPEDRVQSLADLEKLYQGFGLRGTTLARLKTPYSVSETSASVDGLPLEQNCALLSRVWAALSGMEVVLVRQGS